MNKHLVRLLLCGLTIPAAAGAQYRVEVGPLFGYYAPTGTFRHDAQYYRVGTPDQPRELLSRTRRAM